MRKLLVINPNTSASVSSLLQSHATSWAGPDVHVQTLTARFGAPYIACEASYAVAGHAVLDVWAQAQSQGSSAFDSVLIGCFGDPGLMALRENCAVPVTGLAEAAFVAAAKTGRFAIVTGGERWQPILQRLAHSLGFGRQLAGIYTVAPSGAEMAQAPEAAQALLTQACQQAVLRFGADVVIVGGAGLAGMAARIQPDVNVPLIDSVAAGIQLILTRPTAASPHSTGSAEQAPHRFDFSWSGVSDELAALGTARRQNDLQR